MARWLESHAEEGYAVKAMDDLGKRRAKPIRRRPSIISLICLQERARNGNQERCGHWAKEGLATAGGMVEQP